MGGVGGWGVKCRCIELIVDFNTFCGGGGVKCRCIELIVDFNTFCGGSSVDVLN